MGEILNTRKQKYLVLVRLLAKTIKWAMQIF